jgi:hypothetical protein
MKDEIMLIGTSSASAYVFARNGRDLWYERRMLVGAGSDQFGGSVFTDGETIAIGAPFDNSIGFHTGAAYVSRLPLIVQIDAPEDSGNRVNPFSRGVIPVAILGGDSFDVADVDVTTLAFGPAGAPPAHNLTDSFTYNDHLQDVNLDGYMDLVTHFRTRDTGIACGDSSATLTGELLDGQPFEGTDSIQTVGCRETRRPAIWMKDEEKAGEPRGGIVNLERK